MGYAIKKVHNNRKKTTEKKGSTTTNFIYVTYDYKDSLARRACALPN